MPDMAPCPSLCYFLPLATPAEKVLGLAWHGQDLASLPSVSKQTSFFENIEGNPVEKKETLWPSGICRNLSGAPNCG